MIRITGGTHRGRVIATPKGHTRTRPTQAKLREALFSMLYDQVLGARVADFFAGCGALGFEALSRGASHVTFIEKSRATARLIETNSEQLGFKEQSSVFIATLPHAYHHVPEDLVAFDIIFADPPYFKHLDCLTKIDWLRLLSPSGRLIWESDKTENLPSSTNLLEKEKARVYGNTMVSIYRLKGDPA